MFYQHFTFIYTDHHISPHRGAYLDYLPEACQNCMVSGRWRCRSSQQKATSSFIIVLNPQASSLPQMIIISSLFNCVNPFLFVTFYHRSHIYSNAGSTSILLSCSFFTDFSWWLLSSILLFILNSKFSFMSRTIYQLVFWFEESHQIISYLKILSSYFPI